MRNSFQRVIATLNLFQGKQSLTIFMLAAIFALTACGDDDSSSPSAKGLPAEVADKAELETYECSMDVIGEKVYVTELEENYECDGEKWFKSYDQTKPSSTKSSSSKKSDGSSDSKTADKDGSSSSDATTSSSSAKSSSSRPTEILEPEITVNETCTEVGACDAMVKADISTWHFVRKDAFGDDAEYTYAADGKDLIITIKNADGSKNSKTYSMYNMESEVGMEMAFNAAKATCEDGGGNDNKIKSCVKDTVKTLPKCNTNLEGVIGIDTTGIKVICRENEWQIDVEYGSLMDDRDGQSYKIVKIGDQWWMAENLNYADSIATPSLSGKSWCFNNEPDSCTKYGRLYTWAAAMDSVKTGCGYNKTCSRTYPVRGICPEGWHLPRYGDWNTLFTAVGGSSTAGAKLKSQTGWKTYDGITNEDSFGFSALPAGYRHNDGDYYFEGLYAYFWSSTEGSSAYAYYLYLDYDNDSAYLDDNDKDDGHSVRCIKDSD